MIFLSHSSKDRELASELAIQLKSEFETEVFLSSRPDSIPSGKSWFDWIMAKLGEADALVILVTVPSENSVWVGFELGYFWRKTTSKSIHALYHPTAKIPSPLDFLQAKLVTNAAEIESFLNELCKDLQHQYHGKVDITRITQKAKEILVEPPDRTLEKFEHLLENAMWKEGHLFDDEVWICSDDVTYQIVVDMESHEDFVERWSLKFPDSRGSSKWKVRLSIVGVAIEELYFVSVDGGRYFVPLPEIEAVGVIDEGKVNYYWDRESLSYKVGQVIAKFYSVHPSFEDFATHTGIEIR